MDNFSLKNKNAIVLGGSGLIGRKVSIEIAKAGANVLILDKNKGETKKVVKEVGKLGESCSGTYFDCADMDRIEDNLKKIISEFCIPDIFINCTYPRTKDWTKNSFKKIKLLSYRRNIDIHLNSYSWTARLIAEEMAKKKIKGSIIMTSSIYGIKAQDLTIYEGTNLEENMTYAVIKAGIIQLVKQMASYYGRHNIRVNAICPGGLEGNIAGKKVPQDKLFKRRYIKKTPLGRMANPQDIANSMIFLSSEAAAYITGQAIIVDGGISVV